MRAFAEGYGPRELENLCRYAGRISWGHVQLLLGVEDADARVELERTVAEKSWAVSDLRLELKRRRGRRGAGGRTPKLPDTLEAGFGQLAEAVEQWFKRCRLLAKWLEDELPKRLTGDARKRAGEVLSVLGQLREAEDTLAGLLQETMPGSKKSAKQGKSKRK